LSSSDTQRFWVDCFVGGLKVLALVDPGATHTIISTALLTELKKKLIKLNMRKSTVTLADDREVPITGTATIPISLEENGWVGECLLMENTSAAVTLGMNTLRGLKMILNLHQSKLAIVTPNGTRKIQAYYCDDEPVEAIRGILRRKGRRATEVSSLCSSIDIGQIEKLNLYRDLSGTSCDLENNFKLTEKEQSEFDKNLESWKEKFKTVKGKTDVVKHKIYVKPGTVPIKQRYYTVNPATQKVLHEELQKLIDEDLVQESSSPWSSPVLLVKKRREKIGWSKISDDLTM